MTKPKDTSEQEQIEHWLLTDKAVAHTLKLVPQSQRDLFVFEMSKHIQSRCKQERKAVIKEINKRVDAATQMIGPKMEFTKTIGRNQLKQILEGMREAE